MFYNLINRSTAAFGGAPFRSNLCTALGSAGAGAGAGAAADGGRITLRGLRQDV